MWKSLTMKLTDGWLKLFRTGWYNEGNFSECSTVAQQHVECCLEHSGQSDLMSSLFKYALEGGWSQELFDLASIYGMHKQGIISEARKKKNLSF